MPPINLNKLLKQHGDDKNAQEKQNTEKEKIKRLDAISNVNFSTIDEEINNAKSIDDIKRILVKYLSPVVITETERRK